jgi:hypothetical protein
MLVYVTSAIRSIMRTEAAPALDFAFTNLHTQLIVSTTLPAMRLNTVLNQRPWHVPHNGLDRTLT